MYQLDVGKLRNAFVMSQGVAEMIKAFRSERNAKIYDLDTPVPIKLGCKMVVHIIPLSAFASAEKLDIARNQEILCEMVPLTADGKQMDKITLEGVLNYTNVTEGRSRAYTQVFRSRVVEAVAVFGPGDGGIKRLHSKTYERLLIRSIQLYFRILRQIGFVPPDLSLCWV